MKYKNKVYIILLNYNGWKDTLECLESILKNNYDNHQIIVVDNNSPDNSMSNLINWSNGTQEIVYSHDSKLINLSQPSSVKPLEKVFYTNDEISLNNILEKEKNLNNPIIFIQSGKNEGFASGNNVAIKYALEKSDFEYVWLLNNDTVIESNALTSLVDYASSNDFGIVGSKLFNYYDSDTVQAYGGHINKFFGTSTHITKEEDLISNLDYVVGASFLINKKVIDKIGLLPEDYFLFYEETDYCFNAKNSGFKIGVDVNSIVYHKEGNATGSKAPSKTMDLLQIKNRMKFHKKYLGGGIGIYLSLMAVILNRIKRFQFDRAVEIAKYMFLGESIFFLLEQYFIPFNF